MRELRVVQSPYLQDELDVIPEVQQEIEMTTLMTEASIQKIERVDSNLITNMESETERDSTPRQAFPDIGVQLLSRPSENLHSEEIVFKAVHTLNSKEQTLDWRQQDFTLAIPSLNSTREFKNESRIIDNSLEIDDSKIKYGKNAAILINCSMLDDSNNSLQDE